MGTTVKANLIKIGNSQGIRIPKLLLDQARLSQQVEVEAQVGQLVIRSVTNPPRQGWDEEFKKMAAQGDDKLLDEDIASTSQWDENEWHW